MSNGESSSLKRAVDTAFGKENDHKAKRSRRKRSRISELQLEPVQKPESALSKKNAPSLQNGPSQAPGPSKPKQKKSVPDVASVTQKTGASEEQESAKQSNKILRKQRRSLGPKWSFSAVEGGRFADHDPLMVQGDKYMILAVRTQILVYSTSTSLLVRSLRLGERERVTSYTVSATNKNHLLVATYSGIVLKWDWTTGQEINQWKSSEKLLFITEQSQDKNELPSSTLLLIHEASDQNRKVSLATFPDSSDSNTNQEVILGGKLLASYIKILDQGRCLLLYADDKIIFGQASQKPEGAPIMYVWREIVIPNTITSLDARSRSLSSSSKRKREAVDLVVGCQNGSILIYDDLLSRLMSKEKNPTEDDIVSRRFHWHRNEVLTVKWSLDGNYIISGGHETVMVIWQLDTGQQQFLPHLSAAIQNLTISNTGSAYAVHLADNSVMVLSTAELQPTAYISSLVVRQRRSNEKRPKRIPAALQQKDPTLLALAVSADRAIGSGAAPQATLLQTYDIRAQKQSQRQALVRNNITALNVDPSGKPVQEPDVTHLKISHDGKWLATVDEWSPSENDLRPLYVINEASNAKEVFLKFWARNELTRSWELVTRIQSPHSTRSIPSSSILDLEANSQRPEFSTMSSDGSINVWTPKVRHRNGLPIKDQLGSRLYTWTCTHTIEIPNPHNTSIPTASALAYSPDGSVLAVSSNKSPFIHFIDPLLGIVQHIQQGSHPGLFSHLTFLNHHLITVSRDLRVYNTVSGDLLYALALKSSISDVYLATNELDQTFAVVCILPAFMSKEKGRSARARSQVMVFDLNSATPIFRKVVDGTVEILLPLPGEGGYLVINDEGEVVYLKRPGSGVVRKKLEVPLLEEPTRTTTGLEDMFGRRRIEDGTMVEGVDGDERAQIMPSYKTQSSLSDIFNNHPVNLPVSKLFEQVVAVIKGSPEVQGG